MVSALFQNEKLNLTRKLSDVITEVGNDYIVLKKKNLKVNLPVKLLKDLKPQVGTKISISPDKTNYIDDSYVFEMETPATTQEKTSGYRERPASSSVSLKNLSNKLPF